MRTTQIRHLRNTERLAAASVINWQEDWIEANNFSFVPGRILQMRPFKVSHKKMSTDNGYRNISSNAQDKCHLSSLDLNVFTESDIHLSDAVLHT